ncbi:hypothetical protein MMC13_001264 [Lambiella insularis]|nr:hypothetical protein [Lambiella insularis]
MATYQPFPRVVIASLEGRPQSIRYRHSQLRQLQTQLINSKETIISAIKADFDHTDLEADFECALLLSELRQHYEALDPPKELAKRRQIADGKDSIGKTKSVGIVYIVPSKHTLLYSALSPLCAAIAAGNCVIVELPQTLARLTSVLRKLLQDSLDKDSFAVSESRPPGDFMRQCTLVQDYEPEAPHNTRGTLISPNALRSVAVVDRTARIEEAAHTIVQARMSRRGSSPYAPDVVLVNEFVVEKFMTCTLQHVARYMAHSDALVNGHSHKKPRQPLWESEQIVDNAEKSEDIRVVTRGSRGSILYIQNRESALLRQKINGPVLLVHPISSLDDGIEVSKLEREQTLAASYVFAALPEANYLANSIDAHISSVNHIPAELLVGPVAPLHHHPAPTPRYAPFMFQESRPQLLHKSTMTCLFETETTDSKRFSAAVAEPLTAPLPPKGRRHKNPLDFFLTGLLTSAVLIVVPSIVGLGVGASYSFPYLRSWVLK